MDYKKLAAQIASAEDPYEEFAKEASDLDAVHKTTLAREVNKQFFISRLDGKDSDGNIEFNVIEPEIIGSHTSRVVGDPTVEKVASEHGAAPTDKRLLVSDSMFVISPSRTIKSSSLYGGSEATFRKTAEHIIDSEHEKKATEDERIFNNDKNRAIAILNDMFGAGVEDITKIANDASELRGVMGIVIESGLGEIIPEMLAITNDAESTLLKVASVDMDRDRTDELMASLDRLLEISEAKALVKQASCKDSLDKLAFIPALLGGVASLGFSVAKGLAKGAKGTVKGAWKSSKVLGGISSGAVGAVKNTARLKSPIKGAIDGYKSGSGIMGGLTTAGLIGGTALQAGPAMDKYQKMTLGRI